MSAWRRKDFLRQWHDAQVKLARGCSVDESYDAREARRIERAREWSSMRARHEIERAQVLDDESAMGACEGCGATIGAPCIAGAARVGYRSCYSRPKLDAAHRAEVDAFKSRTRRREDYGRPTSPSGTRARWAELRARHGREVASARASARRAVFNGRTEYRRYGANDRYSPVQRYTRESPLQLERRRIADRAREARRRIDQLEARGARDSWENLHARHARDSYRQAFKAGPLAVAAWRIAGAGASARFYPERYGAGLEAQNRRVREVLSIYGTAHTAREVVRVKGGAVYVRGRVSHRPELDSGRPNRWDTAPEHAPLELAPDRWFLAIRNRVPRARSRA